MQSIILGIHDTAFDSIKDQMEDMDEEQLSNILILDLRSSYKGSAFPKQSEER